LRDRMFPAILLIYRRFLLICKGDMGIRIAALLILPVDPREKMRYKSRDSDAVSALPTRGQDLFVTGYGLSSLTMGDRRKEGNGMTLQKLAC